MMIDGERYLFFTKITIPLCKKTMELIKDLATSKNAKVFLGKNYAVVKTLGKLSCKEELAELANKFNSHGFGLRLYNNCNCFEEPLVYNA